MESIKIINLFEKLSIFVSYIGEKVELNVIILLMPKYVILLKILRVENTKFVNLSLGNLEKNDFRFDIIGRR